MVITAFFDSYSFNNNNFVEMCCREEYKFLVDRIVGAVVQELGIYVVFQYVVWCQNHRLLQNGSMHG
jgi:hypothetical protein